MAYEAREILPKRFAADMTHIALGTVAEVDTLVSWNFKHIVRLEKIRLFNALNVELGYRVLSILSLNPSEFLELPEPLRAALRRRGCTIPQVYRVLRARNPDGKDDGFKLKHSQKLSDCSRREDAMGMHERWSGEYEYDIDVLPLVPPMSNGNSHEAKVAPRSASAIESSGMSSPIVVPLAAGQNGSGGRADGRSRC
jgi:hypothetical protein